MRFSTLCVATACVLTIALAGCGGGAASFPKADVSGVITLDGKPLADVEVHFINEETKFGGFGKTDSSGRYSLIQGAAVGANKVFFAKIDETEFDPDPESGMDEGQFEAREYDTPDQNGKPSTSGVVPTDYTAENSKLTYEVLAGGATDADFKLVTRN